MDAPVRFARYDDLHIAYRVFGNDPIDVVQIPNWLSHAEAFEQVDPIATMIQGVASFSRLVYFDMPGGGLSDPLTPDRPQLTLEEYAECTGAVMDDAGIERAWILAYDFGAQAAVMFAATYPERTHGLVLHQPVVKSRRDDDFPDGLPDEALDALVETLGRLWATDEYTSMVSPSLADLPETRDQMKRLMRAGRSPGSAQRVFRIALDTDVSDLLPVVRVPTVILFPREQATFPLSFGTYVADRIPGAQLVELPGANAVPIFNEETSRWIEEVRSFVTGVRGESIDGGRALTTVLLTDIVGSTERASELGDKSWRSMIERHDQLVRTIVSGHGGRLIRTTGDGALATFDGPVRAIRCGDAIAKGVRTLGLEARVGLHTGEVERHGGDITGLAVHIAARVSASASAGQVLVSHAIPPLVAGCGISFVDVGRHELKGVPGNWGLLAAQA